MERFISAVSSAIENQNWYATLYLSLTLPDICAKTVQKPGQRGIVSNIRLV